MVKMQVGLFCFFLGFFSNSYAQEIEYSNNKIHFKVVKDKTSLRVTDQMGERSLKIIDCNRSKIEKFWKSMTNEIEGLQGPRTDLKKPLASGSWVKYEGVKFNVLDFEPAFKFFNQAPAKTLVLFAESKKTCRKK